MIDTVHYETYLWGAIALDSSIAYRILPLVDPSSWRKEYWTLIHLDMLNSMSVYETPDYLISAQRVNVKRGIPLETMVDGVYEMYSTSQWERMLSEYLDAIARNKIADGCIKIAKRVHDLSSNDMASEVSKLLNIKTRTADKVSVGSMLERILDQSIVENYFKTGISMLDRLLDGGLVEQQLVILAGRPGMGKTAFATSIAILSAKILKNEGSNGRVMIVSLEMGARELSMRMLSQYSNVPFKDIKNKQAVKKHGVAFQEAALDFEKLPIDIIDIAGITIGELRSIARQEKDLKLIILDYIQLVTPEKPSSNRNNDVAQISRDLKKLAKERMIPVITLSQLSRDADKRNINTDNISRPSLSDLRDSGAIEQDADMVWFVHRDNYYKKEKGIELEDAVLDIAKHRNGEVGEIPIVFKKSCMRFS